MNKSSAYYASSVTVADALPPQVTFVSATNSQGTFCSYDGVGNVSCTLVNMGVGSNVVATINVTAATDGLATNFAIATAFDFDSNTNNNFATQVTTIVQLADLALGMTGSLNTGFAGSNITYNITITNLGPSVAPGVVLTDTLPPGTTFISGSPSPSTISAGTITWNLGSLAATTNTTTNVSFSL